MKLPRVTTETGVTIGGGVTESIHANNLLSLYLDQFKRGWNHTAVYLLRDRADEGGNQQFGFYRPDNTPRLAAIYLHNLTTILSDTGHPGALQQLAYSIPNEPATTHDLLLEKSDHTFFLVVWSERLQGREGVEVNLPSLVPQIQIYDPTVGTDPISTLSKQSTVRLLLTDHPLILALPRKR